MSALSITAAAARHVREQLRRAEGAALRVRVRNSGCSGYRYHLSPVQSPRANDEVFREHDVTLVVDRRSLLLLAGTRIDYVREGLNSSLKFHNPNVTATCGCGQSFAAAPPDATVHLETTDGTTS